MMNYEGFVEVLKEELLARVKDKHPELEVEFPFITKVNFEKECISIGKVNGNVKVNIYFDELYDEFVQEPDFDKLVDKIINQSIAEVPFDISRITEVICDMNEIKQRLYYSVINTERNIELIKDIPHRELLDLSVIYKLRIEMDNGFSTVIIKNEMLKKWEMTENDLFELAKANTERILPFVVNKMSDQFIILTNKEFSEGAVAICDEELLCKLSDEMNDNLYVIPSSIHDLIVLNASAYNDDEIRSIIKHVNDNIVDETEILSYNLYYYNRDTSMMSIV